MKNIYPYRKFLFVIVEKPKLSAIFHKAELDTGAFVYIDVQTHHEVKGNAVQVYHSNHIIWQTATNGADGRRGEDAPLILHQKRLC